MTTPDLIKRLMEPESRQALSRLNAPMGETTKPEQTKGGGE